MIVVVSFLSLNAMATERVQMKDKNFEAKNLTELFLSRVAAFQNLGGPATSEAEVFLLKTMTIPKDAYQFERKKELVKKILRWDEPEILAIRDQEDVRAIVYRIGYKTLEGKDFLHEISFFVKNEQGQYSYTHKYNLAMSPSMTTQTSNTPIRQYGDQVLGKGARPVKDLALESDQVAAQLNILKKALKKTGGVGIAANQSAEIEEPLQIILAGIDYTNEESVRNALRRYPRTLFPQLRVYLNPRIVEAKGWLDFGEGCLSLRGSLRGSVGRAESIKVSYLDLDGHEMIQEFSGADARVMQHEVDHIVNGKVFFDHVVENLTRDQLFSVFSAVTHIIQKRSLENGNPDKGVPTLLPDPEFVFIRNSSGQLTFDPVHLERSLEHHLTSALLGIQKSIQGKLDEYLK